jgi:hypothetical protein
MQPQQKAADDVGQLAPRLTQHIRLTSFAQVFAYRQKLQIYQTRYMKLRYSQGEKNHGS